MYSTVRESRVIYSAYTDRFLDDVLDKCWEQLEFLNTDTEGGMRHLRQKYNSQLHKKASMLNKQSEESGFKSEIVGIVADLPRKLRGGRGDRVFNFKGHMGLIAGKPWELNILNLVSNN